MDGERRGMEEQSSRGKQWVSCIAPPANLRRASITNNPKCPLSCVLPVVIVSYSARSNLPFIFPNMGATHGRAPRPSKLLLTSHLTPQIHHSPWRYPCSVLQLSVIFEHTS